MLQELHVMHAAMTAPHHGTPMRALQGKSMATTLSTTTYTMSGEHQKSAWSSLRIVAPVEAVVEASPVESHSLTEALQRESATSGG